MVIYFIDRNKNTDTPGQIQYCVGDVIVQKDSNRYEVQLCGLDGMRTLCSVVYSFSMPVQTKSKKIFEFDPLAGRSGNEKVLKFLTSVFKEQAINNFFEDALHICAFKKDSWNADILSNFYGFTIDKPQKDNIESNSAQRKYFFEYFPSKAKLLFDELIKSNNGAEDVFRKIRAQYSEEYTRAFKFFKTEHPESNIYYGFPDKQHQSANQKRIPREKLKKLLFQWRVDKAIELGVQDWDILRYRDVLSISENAPASIESLTACGLRARNIKRFGTEIINLINKDFAVIDLPPKENVNKKKDIQENETISVCVQSTQDVVKKKPEHRDESGLPPEEAKYVSSLPIMAVLEKWRNKVTTFQELYPWQVLAYCEMEKIALIRPSNLTLLKCCGVSRETMNVYGADILNIVKRFYPLEFKPRKTESEAPLECSIKKEVTATDALVKAELSDWRRMEAKKKSISVSQFMSMSQLKLILNTKPTSKDDLKKCGLRYGFISLYGDKIIEIVNKHKNVDHKIKSKALIETQHDESPQKEEFDYRRYAKMYPDVARSLSSTIVKSFLMYKSGISLCDIALDRKMTETTVGMHLAKCIEKGFLDAHEIVNVETYNKIAETALSHPDDRKLSRIFDECEGKYEYTQIRYVISDLKAKQLLK